MSTDDSLTYVTFLADKMGLPLSQTELWGAADRAVEKRADLAPLYAALADAPVEGATIFRPLVAPAPRDE